MDTNSLRVEKLRQYLFDIVVAINSKSRQINVNMLSNDINNYSLDKIPVSSEVERWITGLEIHRDVFSFRSRTSYSQEVEENLENIGFFELFEEVINSNNKEGVLPDIDGIESIACLNCGTMLSNDNGHVATFDIQIQITYIVKNNSTISL